MGTTLDITERKAAEDGRNLLMGELAHRAKNGIAVIMAIVSQTARGQESVATFEATLMARLQAMAISQDFVMASGGRPVDLAGLVRQALTAFGLSRFEIDPGLEGVTIQGQLAVGLGLLLHELATNATKYGALSASGGSVTLRRQPAPNGRAAFEWIEAGGPAVTPPSRKGFGTRLLELASWLMIRRALKEGEITAAEARTKRDRVKLKAPGRPAHVKGYAELPEGLRGLIDSSYALNDRIFQIDLAIEGCQQETVRFANPVGAQVTRLEEAFSRPPQQPQRRAAIRGFLGRGA